MGPSGGCLQYATRAELSKTGLGPFSEGYLPDTLHMIDPGGAAAEAVHFARG